MENLGFRPLCPALYELLEERFGSVKVANEGEELVANPYMDPATSKVRWDIMEKGEHYFINCPFCNDTRQRLGISYCYGQVDENTMRAATWLAHCFNEDCLGHSAPFGGDNRRELEEKIFGFVNREDRIGKYKIEPGRAEPQTLGPAKLPGKVLTLDQLSHTHPAVQYVEGRGHDACELGRTLGVGYCVEADMQYPAVRGRLIVPIVMDGVMVGWQGRYVGDVDWKKQHIPKYYNLPRMAKKLMLYNVDRASGGRIVVLVESVTSVWTIGEHAVALLGHEVSTRQHEIIANRWARKGSLLVMILDADAEVKAAKHFAVMQKTFEVNGGMAAWIKMTDGKDPGDYDREQIWWMIRSACEERGIAIDDYL